MTKIVYTLHDPETKEFLMPAVHTGFVSTEDFQHAIQLHGVEQLEAFCKEYPQAIDFLVKEHMVEISNDHKGTVKELLNMSGIGLPELKGQTH